MKDFHIRPQQNTNKRELRAAKSDYYIIFTKLMLLTSFGLEVARAGLYKNYESDLWAIQIHIEIAYIFSYTSSYIRVPNCGFFG